MALRAGYYGLKKKLLEKVNTLPGIKSIGNGLSLNSTTGVLSATSGGNKADLTLIATVQTTLTASKAYAVGEQFVYNQVLYKVTQAIAQGATITIGTNAVVAGSVTEQLSDFVVVETFDPSISVAAGSVETYRPSIIKSGYKPLGLVGYSILGSNIDNFELVNFAVSSDETIAVIKIRNNSSSTMTGNIYVKVLYKKI